MENTIRIVVTQKDLETKNIQYSASGMVIDELAFSAKLWTEEDVHDANFSYSQDSFDYVIRHFNFERALFEATKTTTQLDELAKALEVKLPLLGWTIEDIDKQELQAGAWLALHVEPLFNELLEAYTQRCKNEASNYDDSNFLDAYCKRLVEQLQKSVERFWENLTNEWLHGDRSSSGVIQDIAKFYGAEQYRYNHEDGCEFVFWFNREDIRKDVEAWSGKKMTQKDAKAWLLDKIDGLSHDRQYALKIEREKRQEKNRELAEHKAKQAREAEAERIEMLKSLKK